MDVGERGNLQDGVTGELIAAAYLAEHGELKGCFWMEHWRDGEMIYAEAFPNTIMTFGANLALDTILAGSGFTATVVMGLKQTGTAVIADTQASHGSWNEAGLAFPPTYSGTRKTPTWSAASGKVKTTSANVAFGMTGGGTVAGAFLNINGSSTIDSTSGTLFSAGDFTGGSRLVISGDTINVGYSLTV